MGSHEHSWNCYGNQLVCVKTPHQHGNDCYTRKGQLDCSLDVHTHDDNCYKMLLKCNK